MKVGIFLPLQTPRPWGADSDARSITEALEQAELADRLGFDFVWAQEHHFLEEYSHSSAPEVLLAAISQRTRTIRIGHGVMLMPPAYNHPARCAERIAMLDQVSGGRVEWGTGASGTRVELESFGIAPEDKHAQWEEGLRTALGLLTERTFAGVEGRYVRMPACTLVPKARQAPHPPLWLACSNRAALREAARRGMGALTFAFLEPDEAKHWVDEYYATFEAECDPIGQAVNPNVAMLSNFSCARERETAIARGQSGAEFFAYGLAHYFRGQPTAPGQTDLWRAFVESEQRPFVDDRRFHTPEALANYYRRFEQAGVDQVIFLQQAGGYEHDAICASLELFGASALPSLKAREPEREAQKRARLAPAFARAEELIAARGRAAQAPVVATLETASPARRADKARVPQVLSECASLVDLLRLRAVERPYHRALLELGADGSVRRSLTYEQWYAAVMSEGRAIARCVQPDQRVLVVGDTGLELAIGLFAVMAAGAVAVPVGKPQPDRGAERFASILRAAAPALLIGADEALTAVEALAEGPLASKLGVLAPRQRLRCDAPSPEQGELPERQSELALVQYTSGSTRQPKGVPITHAMALASLAQTADLFGFSAADRFLTILPLHHTLGLMVHCLSALRSGASCYLLEPLSFAADPLCWLRAVSRHGITVSGAPNFAYEQCARAEPSESGLDLSSWRHAINGGEVARADTIERFTARYFQHGFAAGAMRPSYGMTEATGTITGSLGSERAKVRQVDGTALRGGRVQPGADRALVSNGRVVAGSDLLIVDPVARVALADGEVGEVWLRGAAITTRYEGADASTNEQFGELSDARGRTYLRTRDLGTRVDGELYLLGRRDELVIVRGENVYPDDVEAVAREVLAGALSEVVAHGVEADGSESLCVLVECAPGAPALTRGQLLELRGEVVRRLGVRPARVCWVERLPKTPLGKLQRTEARTRLVADALRVRLELDGALAIQPSAQNLETQLSAMWSRIFRHPIDPARSFFELGGDSLLAAEALAETNRQFGASIALTDVVSCFTIRELASRLRAHDDGPREPAANHAQRQLAQFDEFEITILGLEDVAAAVPCLAAAFARLPMVKMLEPSSAELTGCMSMVAEAAAQRGLSIALYHRPSGRLVGCGLCEDFVEMLSSELPPIPERLAPALALQAALDQRYLAGSPPFERTLHMNLLALDHAFEGRSLPVRLVESTLELAVARGYDSVIVHAASPVVQCTLRERFDFVCVARQNLPSFEFEGTRPFHALDSTSELLLMVRSLRSLRWAAKSRGAQHGLTALPTWS